MVTGIGHLAIRCTDIEASAAFYTQKLNMREAFRMNNDKGELSTVYLIIAPNVFIELFANGVSQPKPPQNAAGFVHLCLQVDNAQAELDRLRADGVPVDRDIMTGRSGCRQFFIHDPDGNVLEMMELLPDSKQAQANREFK